MDNEIIEDLQELSKNVQDVGRKIGSTKIDSDGLEALRDALELSAATLNIYINMINYQNA